ncbi:MAG: CHASE2 domain-containing protein, partial [Pseudomonadota bacterium]
GVHLNNPRLLMKSWCSKNTSAETRETPFDIRNFLVIVVVLIFIVPFDGEGAGLPDSSHARIVIVDVDDKSIEELGRWPWTRDIHGRLINVLNRYGAKAIIFDIIFSEPDTRYPEKDEFLIDVTKKSGNVYFASVFYPLIEGEPQRIERMHLLDRFKAPYRKTLSGGIRHVRNALLPIEGLSVNAKGVGFVNVFSGEKPGSIQGKGMISVPQRGMITQFPLLMVYGEKVYFSLPLLVASDYLSLKGNSIRIIPGSYLRINGLSIPIDSEGDFDLKFSPPYTRFGHYSYIDVLGRKNRDLASILKGALVIVSYNATGLSDYKVTPVSNYFPGSELIATAIDNIVSLAREQAKEK